MAQVTEVRLVDDLDGGNADESVDFTVDNKRYQMDLSEKNAARLREILAPFIAAARRAGGSTAGRTRRSPTSARSSGAGTDTAAIREWAGANGFEVSTRGRIATSIREAYENRAATASAAMRVETPTVEAEVKPKRRSRNKVANPFTAK
jgi:Lsr2